MAVDIQPIAEEHIEGYHGVLDAVARERKYLALEEGLPIERCREFARRNIENGFPQFVALADGKVVGWCDIVLPRRNWGFQHCGGLGMGILAPYRGHGVGTRLLTAALARARAIGLERVELRVFASNARSIALYRKAGFLEEARMRKAVKIDGVYGDLLAMGLLFGGEGQVAGPTGGVYRPAEPLRPRPSGAADLNVVIRPMAEDDAEGLRAVTEAVGRERRYMARLEAESPEATREFVRGNIQKGCPQFVATVEGRVVGACHVFLSESFCFRHTGGLAMAILADFRGRGIGTNLLLAALAKARAIGLELVRLEVFTSNSAAAALYRKAGFVEEGRMRKARKLDGLYDDLLVMSLFLSAGNTNPME